MLQYEAAALKEVSLHAGAFSILPCKRDGADMFTTDDRLKVLTFTGSPAVCLSAARMWGYHGMVLFCGKCFCVLFVGRAPDGHLLTCSPSTTLELLGVCPACASAGARTA